MLHNFKDKGEHDLLAIMCWSTEKYAVSTINAVNRFTSNFDWWNYGDIIRSVKLIEIFVFFLPFRGKIKQRKNPTKR